MTRQIGRRVTVAASCLALLTSCGVHGSHAISGDVPGVTPSGTSMKVGGTATVPYHWYANTLHSSRSGLAHVELSVTAIERGNVAEFRAFVARLRPSSKQQTAAAQIGVPYYLRVTVKNVGSGPMQLHETLSWNDAIWWVIKAYAPDGHEAKNLDGVLESFGLAFPKCKGFDNSNVLFTERLDPGQEVSGCHIVVASSGSEVGRVEYRVAVGLRAKEYKYDWTTT